MKKKLITLMIQAVSLVILIFLMSGCKVNDLESGVYKKAIKQRTKDYEKQGYKPMGSGTIELYVTRGVKKEFETDEEGQNKYFVITTKDIGPTFESASTASRTSARSALAANIETRVAELIKRSVANDALSETSADGINKVIAAGKFRTTLRFKITTFPRFSKKTRDSTTDIPEGNALELKKNW